MRGEHGTKKFGFRQVWGSSPHARGTRPSYMPRGRYEGIIPACAGNTPPGLASPTTCRDHPRMRGEHYDQYTDSVEQKGSSPHARGTLAALTTICEPSGIIPACAGNTSASQAETELRRDHPRMRGEHTPLVSATVDHAGSSPHARGTPVLDSRLDKRLGIIPACAGNTPRQWRWCPCRRDHPRMRGEHAAGWIRDKVGEGSSPHARGTLMLATTSVERQGIIPACAGNTDWQPRLACNAGDHPRMRGEHTAPGPDSVSVQGSSPHARGTLPPYVSHKPSTGIIPACAGNTCVPWLTPVRVGDHPRMRGEHNSASMILSTRKGSSPHARGTPRSGHAMMRLPGIIPACAGNTCWLGVLPVVWRDHPRMRGEHTVSSITHFLPQGSSPHARGTPASRARR